MHAKAGESDRAIRVKMVRQFHYLKFPNFQSSNLPCLAQTFVLWQAESWENQQAMIFLRGIYSLLAFYLRSLASLPMYIYLYST